MSRVDRRSDEVDRIGSGIGLHDRCESRSGRLLECSDIAHKERWCLVGATVGDVARRGGWFVAEWGSGGPSRSLNCVCARVRF